MPIRFLYPTVLVLLLSTWGLGITLSGKWKEISELWQFTVTMIFGSFVAGSTPAAGGAVAFPVFTKLFEVSSSDARTFALMIQSIGMTMATLFIISRGIPVIWRIVRLALLGGVPGLIFGSLLPALPSHYPKLIFTIVIGLFGVAFLLFFFRSRGRKDEDRIIEWTPDAKLHFIIVGFMGGLVSSISGSGIDLLIFITMTLGFGQSERRSISTTVVAMALLSIAGFAFRGIILGGSEGVWNYWLACVPVVAVGAPLGAWVASRVSRNVIVTLILFLIATEVTTTAWIVVLPRWTNPGVWAIILATSLFTSVWLRWLMNRGKSARLDAAFS